MDIQRISNYRDLRFSQSVLNQHGAFLVNEMSYEVEIISVREAIVRGRESSVYPALIEEFRFYAPHISTFYDENRNIIKQYSPPKLLTIPIKDIQPSQFFVDSGKMAAVSAFIRSEEDIIIQVLRHGDRFISLDGHTRLYFAVSQGWTSVRAVEETSEEYIYGFVKEAIRRNIRSPYDLELVSHEEYELKWNQFCDDFFRRELWK